MAVTIYWFSNKVVSSCISTYPASSSSLNTFSLEILWFLGGPTGMDFLKKSTILYHPHMINFKTIFKNSLKNKNRNLLPSIKILLVSWIESNYKYLRIMTLKSMLFQLNSKIKRLPNCLLLSLITLLKFSNPTLMYQTPKGTIVSR